MDHCNSCGAEISPVEIHRCVNAVGPRPEQLPKCQYCQTQPAPIAPVFLTVAGGLRSVAFCCGQCKAIFSVAVIEIAAPQSQVARPSSGIILPS